MAIRNYSVTDNAVVAPAAGTVPTGYVVCLASDLTGYVVATTANRAALSAATGITATLSGIAIGTGAAGAAFPVVGAGHVDASYVGTLSGSGTYVEANASGVPVRSSSISADTIGTIAPDGSIEVNLSLQSGGAVTGNATAIQGVTVSSTAPTRSQLLTYDNSSLIWARAPLMGKAYGLVGDGSDEGTLLQAFLDAGGAGTELVLARPTSYYSWIEPLIIQNTNTAIKIEGEAVAPSGIAALINCRPRMYEPHGTGAAVTAYGNGGSGSNMMTLTLGSYTGTSPTGSYSGGGQGKRVLASESSKWIGRWISIPTAAGMTAGVGGEWQITSVPADDTITVQGGASAADTGLHWRINLPAIIVCAQATTLSGFVVAPYSSTNGGRQWCAFEVNYNQSVANPASMANVRFNRCAVYMNGSGSFRHAWSIARSVVPAVGDANASTNGAGIRQLWHPTQVDTITWLDCLAYMGTTQPYVECAIEHCSNTGQSRDCHWYGGGIFARYPYVNPQRGSVGSSGQLDFHGATFSTPSVLLTTGGSNSRPRMLDDCYTEACGRVLHDRGSGTCEHIIRGGAYGTGTTQLHPSGALIEAAGSGTLRVESRFYCADSTKLHLVECASNSLTKEQRVIIDSAVAGSTTFTGVRGRLDSLTTVGGLLRFAGTETFGLTIDGAAGSFTCSQANFNTACGFTVDLNWVQPWMMMLLTQTQQSGSRCWADADGYRSHVETATEGTGGSIQVSTNTTPMAWAGISVAGVAQQLISKDTGGLVCINRSAGASTDPAAVDLDFAVRQTVLATDVPVPLEKFRKRYYSVATDGQCLEGVTGLAARTTRVRPKNLVGSIDIADAATTGAVTFATNEPDATYRVTSLTVTEKTGAPATRCARVAQGTKAVGGFTIALDAAPGVGTAVTVEWMITRG